VWNTIKLIGLIILSYGSLQITFYYIDSDFFIIVMYIAAILKIIRDWGDKHGYHKRFGNAVVSGIHHSFTTKH